MLDIPSQNLVKNEVWFFLKKMHWKTTKIHRILPWMQNDIVSLLVIIGVDYTTGSKNPFSTKKWRNSSMRTHEFPVKDEPEMEYTTPLWHIQ